MIRFKSLESLDIETITCMMRDFYAIDNYPLDAEVAKKLLEEFITDDNLGKGWIIYYNNEIVGYVFTLFAVLVPF